MTKHLRMVHLGSFTEEVTVEPEISLDQLADELDDDDFAYLCERRGRPETSEEARELCDLVERMLGAWTETEPPDAHRIRMLISDVRAVLR